MILYRVQHRETGMGPYLGRFEDAHKDLSLLDEMAGHHTDRSTHPEPREEWLGQFFTPEHRCAFADLMQLNAWFERGEGDSWLHDLADIGFATAVFEVPAENVVHGERQSAFTGDGAVLRYLTPDETIEAARAESRSLTPKS